MLSFFFFFRPTQGDRPGETKILYPDRILEEGGKQSVSLGRNHERFLGHTEPKVSEPPIVITRCLASVVHKPQSDCVNLAR